MRTHLITHSREKLNECNQCDHGSSYARSLRQHLKTNSGEKLNKCNHLKNSGIINVNATFKETKALLAYGHGGVDWNLLAPPGGINKNVLIGTSDWCKYLHQQSHLKLLIVRTFHGISGANKKETRMI